MLLIEKEDIECYDYNDRMVCGAMTIDEFYHIFDADGITV